MTLTIFLTAGITLFLVFLLRNLSTGERKARRRSLKQDAVNLPNILTMGRVAIIPVVLLLLERGSPSDCTLAALVYSAAALTDLLDGYLARKMNVVSVLGKFLDPLADKLLVAAILIMLVGMSRTPRPPSWLVVIIIGREMAVTTLRAIASGEGIVLPAEELGKYKMIFQMFALHGLLLHYTYVAIDFHLAGMYFLWISTVVSLWSGGLYVARVAREIRTQQRGNGAA